VRDRHKRSEVGVPAVLVHGVPDTAEVWQPILERLERTDAITLALPGFGTSMPQSFGATKDEYAAWIVEQLEEIGEPVDLVGHDWGSLLVQYVGSGHPELIRTWCAGDGAVDVDYVWHDIAQAWQTPEIGEQVVELMAGEGMVDGLREAGHPDAASAVACIDDTMKQAILALYRSAVNVGAEWQPTVERNERPALVLWGSNDPYAPADPYAHRLAERAKGELAIIDGGHWAIFERPDETAQTLERFWKATA
jgi:pimeloyl-ACP methyl ester carboxylesterase